MQDTFNAARYNIITWLTTLVHEDIKVSPSLSEDSLANKITKEVAKSSRPAAAVIVDGNALYCLVSS